MLSQPPKGNQIIVNSDASDLLNNHMLPQQLYVTSYRIYSTQNGFDHSGKSQFLCKRSSQVDWQQGVGWHMGNFRCHMKQGPNMWASQSTWYNEIQGKWNWAPNRPEPKPFCYSCPHTRQAVFTECYKSIQHCIAHAWGSIFRKHTTELCVHELA